MSNWRDRMETESGLAGVTAWLGSYYHVLVLLLLGVFMFWNRAKHWGRFVVDGEVLFPGNDPWYHYRSTKYVVEHFPETMPFDPWTYFSYGTSNSQFGTIYDQLMGTAAMIVGLGDPSDHVVRLVMLFAPVVFGVAILVPTYYLGKRLGKGRLAGLAAATIVAFASGGLLSKGISGTADHQIAEAFFQAFAALGMVAALAVAEREMPIYELFAEREFDALRRPLAWSVLGGFTVGLYLWVWPPGIVFLGILGVFVLIHLSAEVVRGNSPEPVAIAVIVAMATAGIMNLASLSDLTFTATGNSLMQPGMAFGLAIWCGFMAWLARRWDSLDVSRYGYPVATLAVLAAGVVAAMVGLPSLYNSLANNVIRVLGFMFQQTGSITTVGEGQPLTDLSAFYAWYGLAAIFAVLGVAMVLYRHAFDDEPRGETLLVTILLAFVVAMTLTQSRFSYYITVPLAAMAAIPLGAAFRLIAAQTDADQGVELYQVMTVLMVILLVIPPMFMFGVGPIRAASSGPGDGIQGWENSLNWLDDETPVPGTYDNPDGEEMALYGKFSQQADFDHPAGSYGIMSWWDYGHWITAKGDRIPVANPFQQGANTAARFLLSPTEQRANGVLSSIAEDDAETRYVMVDWKMITTYGTYRSLGLGFGGKFFAPPAFVDNVSQSDFYDRIYLRNQTSIGLPFVHRQTQAYYDSMVARLYLAHGSAMEPRPFVVDWNTQSGQTQSGDQVQYKVARPGQPLIRGFANLSAARAFVAEDGTAQVGGVGPYPSERVPALEHYRLVHESSASAMQSAYIGAIQQTFQGADVAEYLKTLPGLGQLNQNQLRQFGLTRWMQQTSAAWTKTFERVPGATLTGSGPTNTTVTASVEMRALATNETFTYQQQARTGGDGAFELTVPYSTTGYAAYGPENGHTNVSVRATGPYTLSTPPSSNGTHVTTYRANATVSEAAVLGDEAGPITVDLSKRVTQIGQVDNQTDNATGGDQGGSTDGGDGGSTNETNQGRLSPPSATTARTASLPSRGA